MAKLSHNRSRQGQLHALTHLLMGDLSLIVQLGLCYNIILLYYSKHSIIHDMFNFGILHWPLVVDSIMKLICQARYVVIFRLLPP